MIQEIERKTVPGFIAIPVLLVVNIIIAALFVQAVRAGNVGAVVVTVIVQLIALALWFGFFTVNPNEARVLQLFGRYVGTVREPGLRFANPLFTKQRVSTRVRNFETDRLKVNDADSNPIDIAAVVVWRVVDTAEALFEVDNYEEYVQVQSEAALRGLATNYPYAAHNDEPLSLSANAGEISNRLTEEIQERLAKAGVEVVESRISHLAYAPEIASAMLQRQQANAIIAARQKIVEGAVSMVEMALADLSKRDIIEFDEERKAQMVSNLLVVLCSDRNPQPIVNTGS